MSGVLQAEQVAKNPYPDAAGFVLAGGQSRRMGRDKALIEFAGRPLIAHAVSTLSEVGLQPTIAGAQPGSRAALEAFAPVIEDSDPGRGPLGGVCSALASSAGRWAIFVSIDQPLLPASLLKYLIHHADVSGLAVTLASVSGFTQTFPAVLDRRTLPTLLKELGSGRGRCFAAFREAATSLGEQISSIPVEFLAQAGAASHPYDLPISRWLMNLNSPEDLTSAEALMGVRIA